jgi:Fic family protein
LIFIVATNLDFLCIHPFHDGNGRVSRLMLLVQLYNAGFEVGRYISIERLIEEHKERYYEALRISSEKWHEEKQDPWPYLSFILYILKKAYDEFIEGVEKIDIPRGGKTKLVISCIEKFRSEFTLSQIHEKCPDVSRDMIRKVLKDLNNEGKIESEGRGPGARWHKKGNNV